MLSCGMKKTSKYKDKSLTDVKWNDENFIRLSRYEPTIKRYHHNDAVNDFIIALKKAADKEPQRFCKKLKKEAIERVLERLEE